MGKLSFQHIPVLLEKTLEGLNPRPGDWIADCTIGGGGHAEEILKRISPGGFLLGIDRDPAAVKAVCDRLSKYKDMITLVNDRNIHLPEIAEKFDIKSFDGILFDLGVSSFQLDEARRGFSYQTDAPLDMRMNPNDKTTAKDIVNHYSKEELISIVSNYGEERWAARIAQRIVKERESKPIETTAELVKIIKQAIPAAVRRSGPHPAKRTFQAIRIEVNSELSELEQALENGIKMLHKKGRICVISFHSLEDRIVKQVFQKAAKGCVCPPDFPVCNCGIEPSLKMVNRKPIESSDLETSDNPRARSAKLRVGERI